MLAVATGYGAVERAEKAIAATTIASAAYERRIYENNEAIEHATMLRGEQLRAWRDLSRVSKERGLAFSTAELLRRLEVIAEQFKLKIVSITPARDVAGEPATRGELLATPMTLSVRGVFPAVVRFVQELTRQRPLVGLDTLQLVASSGSSTRATPLDVAIHLTLYRLILSNVDAATH